MYSSTKTASSAGRGQLSQSALSYLQGLEQSTKRLRTEGHEKPKPPTGLSSRRGSLSSMISQLRSGKSLDSSGDEDVFNESFGKLSSILDDSSESSGREKVLLDLNFDSLPSKSTPNPQLPGLVAQVGRSSISELRELRNSIDQSLQQATQNLKKDSARNEKPKPRRSIFKKQESEELSEVEEEAEIEREETKKPTVPKKSPFKNAVESGSSDLESIDFEVSAEPVERLRGRKVSFRTPTPSESDVSSSESSSSSSTESSKSSSNKSSPSSSVSSSVSTLKASSRKSSSSSSSSTAKADSSEEEEEKGYDSDFETNSRKGGVESPSEAIASPVSSAAKTAILPSATRSPVVENQSDENLTDRNQHTNNESNRSSPPVKAPLKEPMLPVFESAVEKTVELLAEAPKPKSSPPPNPSPPAARDTATEEMERRLQEMMKSYVAEGHQRREEERRRTEQSISSTTQTDDDFLLMERKEMIGFSPLQEALLVSDGVKGALRTVVSAHIQMVEEMNRLEWDTKRRWQQELDRLKAVVDSPSMDKLNKLIEERCRKTL